MVRETRHLWVGNLPDNIREDRIREHFKRYGRVQSIKLLGRTENPGAVTSATACSGICATVAFMDIKSASKAHNTEHVLDERTLTTEYYEPTAIPSVAGAPSAGSSPAGSGYSGSSSSVNSAPTATSVSRFHLSGGEDSASTQCAIAATAAAPANWRGTNDSATDFCRRGSTPATYGRYQRNSTTAPYSTPPSNADRSSGGTARWYGGSGGGGESTPSTPGGAEPSRRRRRSGSGSSHSDSSSPDASDASRASTPHAPLPAQPAHNHRTPPANHHQWSSSTASGRPLAICVRNLPTRSTDSSLKDGLYHEYKKHGKVVWVKIVGQNADRYAVVRFKKPSDVEKALEVSQDKLFFGCKISVAPHQSCDDDTDSVKPYETDIDEYHPKATRTLFIGNLEKDVTQQQIRDKFKHFGRIIEVDIKKGSGGGAGYAFCQYASISSVVDAIRAMDGEYVGGSRVKLGFGKPVATTCVWVDGLTEHTEKQVLAAVGRCGAAVSVCVDRAAGAALVHFEQAAAAGGCVRELRRVAAATAAAEPAAPRLAVDYASKECQEAFYEQLEKHGGAAALTGAERLPADRLPPRDASRLDSLRYENVTSRSRASSYGRSSSRTPRYPSLEHYDTAEYAAERRYRVYDELGSSPQGEDGGTYEERLQSVVVSPVRSRRHRRSSPDERKTSRERHAHCGRRSRSGSLGGRRRRHRRRRDTSAASRAGTPLRDEPPVEPRRPPAARPPLPMLLPLPKFAATLLRARPPTPRPAPDSPPRPPSASSSSAGSAPLSPSLEERIRSLDEKYEKWSGSRGTGEPADRARPRHRLLDIDIHEVPPSDVVRSLLAKRSVFDEDSERLEGARAPSPPTEPRTPRPSPLPRVLRYPYPAHEPLESRGGRPREPPAEGAERDPRRRRAETPPPDDHKPAPAALSHAAPDHLTAAAIISGIQDLIRPDDDDETPSEVVVKSEPDSKQCLPVVKIETDSVDKSKSPTFDEPLAKDSDNRAEGFDLPVKFNIKDENLKLDKDLPCILLKDISAKIDFDVPVKHEKDLPIKPDKEVKKLNSNCLSNHNHINSDSVKTETLTEISVVSKSRKDILDRSQDSHKNKDKQKEINIFDFVPIKVEKKDSEVTNEKSCEIELKTIEIPSWSSSKKLLEAEKLADERSKNDRDKSKHSKDKYEKEKHDQESCKPKSNKYERSSERHEKEKRPKDEHSTERSKSEKDAEKSHRDKYDKDSDKSKTDDKSRYEHHKRDKQEKDKKKDNAEFDKVKKDDRHKHEKTKKDGSENNKREMKKDNEGSKSRKHSRDESSKEVCRKDSTDSSASRASHDSVKGKDLENIEPKEESRIRIKHIDLFNKIETDKDQQIKAKIKEEKKEEKHQLKQKNENTELPSKNKPDVSEKQRHHSLDSPQTEAKRKERLNSSSSLPSHIGHKRRMSSQDSLDSLTEEIKKSRNEQKNPERRDSKDSRSSEKPKPPKFNKSHFAKLLESKSHEDRKSQVKHPDDSFIELKEGEVKDQKIFDKTKSTKKVQKDEVDEKPSNSHTPTEALQHDLDFLATLELRSSEEDEKQKALRIEMKEKKRIQQLQQIQELQMQHDALQQAEMHRMKEEKKHRTDEKKKEAVREKRMSTDRKSRDEKIDPNKRKISKKAHSDDTSDSDEPKKHSIFDIVDDEPTYISMYDKVKARSCKNMQKQEEEKRQEKIKAKFSQLKQSRAKREEKKRSSWDEDSDSENDSCSRRPHKVSVDTSSDDDRFTSSKKREKPHININDFVRTKNDYNSSNELDDGRNKLSRKNSRTRIMSDSSDDDISKLSSSPNSIKEGKKIHSSDFELLHRKKENQNPSKDFVDDRIKKNSILNLFGKSDSDDSKLKSSFETDTEYKGNFSKTSGHELLSDGEFTSCNRSSGEFRKKHKKKEKNYSKYSYTNHDSKTSRNLIAGQGDSKQKNCEKLRRSISKKDKRREKHHESMDDICESRDEKIKSYSTASGLDQYLEVNNCNAKKEGKMEDIFGPLSDDSDHETKRGHGENRHDYPTHSYDSTFSSTTNMVYSLNDEAKLKEKEDSKRRKEKRRRERKHFFKEDDNSLDVDAVSKAIEARLFAESVPDVEAVPSVKVEHHHRKYDSFDAESSKSAKYIERVKDKKKKKKKNKDDRQGRKDHLSFHQEHYSSKSEISPGNHNPEMSPKSSLLLENIPLPGDPHVVHLSDKSDDCKSLSQSPSLPRLTDSPPKVLIDQNNDTKGMESDNLSQIILDDSVSMDELQKNNEIENIPMPIDNIVTDLSKVPLPEGPMPEKCNELRSTTEIPCFDIDCNENAVRSITNLQSDEEKPKTLEKHEKIDKKVEEKPRAVISQEETEDAVAALLGESFGGKENTFDSCFEELDETSSHQTDNGNTNIENEKIREEDAEEMRRAVQNLNASEMEIKPDTPVSDNDLLLIDTDTEEADEGLQEPTEKAINIPVSRVPTTSMESVKTSEITNVIITKAKTTIAHTIVSQAATKNNEKEIKVSSPNVTMQHITSTATPVITTSWTQNNKMIEPHVLNSQMTTNHLHNRDAAETKPSHIGTNIVQIKTATNQSVQVSSALRTITTPYRVTAPYQVINQMIRPPTSSMQPPTIKIPESHILYQKSPGLVISPRMPSDPRMQSPKSSPIGENVSPRLAILSTSPQGLNAVGIASPNLQRSPGQVTVVRMQQPPLSPIQTLHLPHSRSMMSPNRPGSVLMQTQGEGIHFNRMPVTPVLAPIPKQITSTNIVQQTNKSISITSASLMPTQSLVTSDNRKSDRRSVEMMCEASKIILSPTNLQHNTNPILVAQNRLISVQNSINATNINQTLHLTNNKVLINKISQLNDKRDLAVHKSDHHVPFSQTPLIHVTGVNPSIIQSGAKPIMCSIQEGSNCIRAPHPNMIHSLHTPRIITTTPISNIIQKDSNKGPPSVLSMATMRQPTVLTKLDTSSSSAVTTNSLTNVIMTPLLLKTSNAASTIRLTPKNLSDKFDDFTASVRNKTNDYTENIKRHDSQQLKSELREPSCTTTLAESQAENTIPGETDFEELLRDTTNEIKVTNDPEKKLEVKTAVGKTVTLISSPVEQKPAIDTFQAEETPSILRSLVDYSEIVIASVKSENEELKTDVSTKSETNVQGTADIKEEKSITSILPTGLFQSIQQLDEKPKLENIDEFKSEDTTQTEKNRHLDDDSWTAKDVNIDSVIKSLCNEPIESHEIVTQSDITEPRKSITSANNEEKESNAMEIDAEKNNYNSIENLNMKVVQGINNKRGGRSATRGKKGEKKQEKIPTRQISKPARGAAARRGGCGAGRGRAKIEKKVKSTDVCSNIPGDVYDFHEDSGDETSASANKNESRPRLILTIKSPLSGQSTAVATSTLSISQKEKIKNSLAKDEKPEDFVSPSTNTRKSRRLQEKDVQKPITDDEDSGKTRTGRRRQARGGARNVSDKSSSGSDTRKSPRGVKRTRDRSTSDASLDSGEERVTKAEEVKESKVPKLDVPVPETVTAVAHVEPMAVVVKPIAAVPATVLSCVGPSSGVPPPLQVAVQPQPQSKPPSQSVPKPHPVTPTMPTASTPAPAPTPAPVSMPIMKPPKKMISEISAKLASAAAAGGGRGEAAAEAETACGVDAAEARVQSPALPHRVQPPHRPPSAHRHVDRHLDRHVDRHADRATPLLIRGGEGDGGEARAAYALHASQQASLPRGAHQPHSAKQVAVVGPHHHHPGAASRVTIPAISPQGQMALCSDVVRSPPPAHQHTSPITSVYHNGDGMYFSHPHYQMYQQHFRATQHDNRASLPYTRPSESDVCEAGVAAISRAAPTHAPPTHAPPTHAPLTQPVRVPRPAHSPAPNDRLIRYAVGCGRSPPPAHGTSRLPGALPPLAAPGPPHASQVPREADSLQMLLQRYPVMWQGLLALKNDAAAVQMHFVGGNHAVAGDTLPRHTDGSTPPLRIAQRMRLEPPQLDQVHRKMKLENEHCILLALPCGRDHMDVLQQSKNLSTGFITYLQRKQAAGIVNVAPPGHHQAMYTVHIFPSCDFANENLSRIAPDLMHRVADLAHLLIVIATV